MRCIMIRVGCLKFHAFLFTRSAGSLAFVFPSAFLSGGSDQFVWPSNLVVVSGIVQR